MRKYILCINEERLERESETIESVSVPIPINAYVIGGQEYTDLWKQDIRRFKTLSSEICPVRRSVYGFKILYEIFFSLNYGILIASLKIIL